MLWLQELVTLANKAKGKAGIKMDIVNSNLGSTSMEDLSMAKPTDQEENLLQQVLSPKVCQPSSLSEANCCYAASSGQWHCFCSDKICWARRNVGYTTCIGPATPC